MARDDPQMKIRLPEDLKASIESAASQSGRTLNAEIVARLQASFDAKLGTYIAAGMAVSLGHARARDGFGEMPLGTLLTDEAYVDKIADTVVERLHREFLKVLPVDSGLPTTVPADTSKRLMRFKTPAPKKQKP